ncbi:MAG: aspartate--tRNA ligase [Candidatus Kuenenbacteria bacterium]
MFRSNTCGELNKKNVGQEIILSGWVHRRRDHGGLIFIDLRDRYGITQVVFQPEISDVFKIAENLRSEWVIKIIGKVMARPDNMINSKLKTGEIEIAVQKLEILNKSKTPPFEIDEEKTIETNENLRLQYRFIDLRRSDLQKLLQLKDKYIQCIRDYFHKLDFIEIQTPILANSSPEGARDFLVPSRLYPNKFYALPQAPQQFKQLLMVGGLDKYFQIAPCFRDEDPRMDRHYGEFYQLDMEMSFVTQEEIFDIMDPLMIKLTENFSNKKNINLEKNNKIRRIPWHEAMTTYGSDKPDLRFEMKIKQITELTKNCGFAVFANAIKNNGVAHALKVEGGAKFSRKDIDELTEIAKSKESKGLAYIKLEPQLNNHQLSRYTEFRCPSGQTTPPCGIPMTIGTNYKQESNDYQLPTTNYQLVSPIIKFLGDELTAKIINEVDAKAGDIIFFGADEWKIVCASLGAVRNECGNKLNLKDKLKAAWCWIIDFPMYSYSEIEQGKIDFEHNPFSMPQGGMEALEKKDPLEILAYQYDLVLNGFEVSSGAIRNHEPEIMYKAFEIAGYTREQVDNKFGAMIRAFEYGAPPHGGNAPGIDRMLMVLQDLDSIRDIYAFPKDGSGKDLMMSSPSEVNEKQLKELGIKII